MKDEIKEILDDTIEYLKGIDETRNTKILTINEINILLDYITNLQNRIDRAMEYLLDKYVRGLLSDDEVNNVVKILKGEDK